MFSTLLLSAACAPLQQGATPIAITLVPYLTTTPSATASQPKGLVEAQSAVVPSATPFQYNVKAGDTLSQIAEQFHVSLDALLAANPDVNPNALTIGSSLKIPSSAGSAAGNATATPVAFAVQQIACHRIADGGAWCFVLVHNDLSDPIENITAQVSLINPGGDSVSSQTATLVLDILPPHRSLPLATFFKPPVPENALPQVQILTAMQLLPSDTRYLPAQIQNTAVKPSASGLSAEVSGEVTLGPASKRAEAVRVAAVSYDQAGNMVGFRQWDGAGGLDPGAKLPFSFILASVAGRIDRVEFAVEARP